MSKFIDTSDDNFGVILNCAVRYSLGRRTYIPKLVMDFIRPLIPHITERTLEVMIGDVEHPGFHGYGDPNIDEPEEAVVQYHPAKSQYVNNYPYCLHLWRPNNGVNFPTPPTLFV